VKRWLAPLGLLVVGVVYLCCSHSPKVVHNEEAPTSLPTDSTETKQEMPLAQQGKTPGPNRFAQLHAKLPTLDAVEKASEEELHHGPPGLKEGSAVLGRVVEEMARDDKAIPDGVAFYRQCAKDEKVLTAIRAVCLKRLSDWAPRAKPPIEVDLSEFSSELRALADHLP